MRWTLSALMSRWMMPRLCASLSDAQHWITIFSIRCGSIGAWLEITWRRLNPSRNSMAMNSWPSRVCPKSNMRIVFGWCRREHALASL